MDLRQRPMGVGLGTMRMLRVVGSPMGTAADEEGIAVEGEGLVGGNRRMGGLWIRTFYGVSGGGASGYRMLRPIEVERMGGAEDGHGRQKSNEVSGLNAREDAASIHYAFSCGRCSSSSKPHFGPTLISCLRSPLRHHHSRQCPPVGRITPPRLHRSPCARAESVRQSTQASLPKPA